MSLLLQNMIFPIQELGSKCFWIMEIFCHHLMAVMVGTQFFLIITVNHLDWLQIIEKEK